MPTVTMSPIGGEVQQFLDNNGAPLVGGLLYSYQAGTTTPLATYTDKTGGTPNANPIVLDSAGRSPSVWITYTTLYKFVLKSSTGVTIATWDNVPGDAASNLITSTKTEADSSAATITALTNAYSNATRSASVQTIPTAGATLQYNSKVTDLGPNYNATTYTYTVPATGTYLVTGSGHFLTTTTGAVGDGVTLNLFKNGSGLVALGRGLIQAGTSGDLLLNGSTQLRLNAGDTITLSANISGTHTWDFQVDGSVFAVTRLS